LQLSVLMIEIVEYHYDVMYDPVVAMANTRWDVICLQTISTDYYWLMKMALKRSRSVIRPPSDAADRGISLSVTMATGSLTMQSTRSKRWKSVQLYDISDLLQLAPPILELDGYRLQTQRPVKSRLPMVSCERLSRITRIVLAASALSSELPSHSIADRQVYLMHIYIYIYI